MLEKLLLKGWGFEVDQMDLNAAKGGSGVADEDVTFDNLCHIATAESNSRSEQSLIIVLLARL